jgi:hypothetical protein
MIKLEMAIFTIMVIYVIFTVSKALINRDQDFWNDINEECKDLDKSQTMEFLRKKYHAPNKKRFF